MIYVVLPAYNEEKNLPPLLEGLYKSLAGSDYKVIVINDGSSDATRDVLARASSVIPLEVIAHEKNKGLGAAIKSGINYLARHIAAGDVVVTMDADNTHPPSLIPVMAAKISAGVGIVIASRFCRGAVTRGVPFYRNILSRAAALVFGLAFGIKGVRDYSSGYRAISGEVLKDYLDSSRVPLVTSTGFSAGTEMLIKLARSSAVLIAETPLDLRYDLKKGASKMKVFSAALEYIKLLGTSRK
ncbi:MAG: glycosyltransferase family 2 protein [Endomicrobiia bacterium]|nr:glycosyltransferase family 2 protein [Endomicrobiia bacterium]